MILTSSPTWRRTVVEAVDVQPYQVEPTDEEENLERWFAFIEGLPDDFERESLRYLWNHPPTSWTFHQHQYYLVVIDITVSGGDGIGGWVKNLQARVASEPKTLGAAKKYGKRMGTWTLRDPNRDLRRNSRFNTQQEAIVEPRILLYCLEGDMDLIVADWVPNYPTPMPTQTLGHEHSWDCIQQIWVS
jgi:hypothetical protein